MKKSIIAIALAFSASAMAVDPSATVVWTGLVPSVTDGTTLKITGLNNGPIQNGTLSVAVDGTYTSTPIVLESRQTIDDALKEATWTVASQAVMFGNNPAAGAVQIIKINGETVGVGDAFSNDTSKISVEVANATPVETLAGAAVQASVTLVATSV